MNNTPNPGNCPNPPNGGNNYQLLGAPALLKQLKKFTEKSVTAAVITRVAQSEQAKQGFKFTKGIAQQGIGQVLGATPERRIMRETAKTSNLEMREAREKKRLETLSRDNYNNFLKHRMSFMEYAINQKELGISDELIARQLRLQANYRKDEGTLKKSQKFFLNIQPNQLHFKKSPNGVIIDFAIKTRLNSATVDTSISDTKIQNNSTELKMQNTEGVKAEASHYSASPFYASHHKANTFVQLHPESFPEMDLNLTLAKEKLVWGFFLLVIINILNMIEKFLYKDDVFEEDDEEKCNELTHLTQLTQLTLEEDLQQDLQQKSSEKL